MPTYDIAGLRFEISCSKPLKLKRLNPFKSCSEKITDIRISLLAVDDLSCPPRAIPAEDEIYWYSSLYDDHTTINLYLKSSGRVAFKLDADNTWSNITISYDKKSPDVGNAICTHIGSLIISNRIVLSEGIVIHASAVSYSDKGIVFTAPSGTGKSTHAALWEKHLRAEIINDDSPVIRYDGCQNRVYGTPWSGSTDRFTNSSVPLSALVVLEKADENSIRELSDEESVQMILPRIFLPYHDPRLLDKAISNSEEIIRSVPKYLLKCKPEYEAMELVRKCIM